MSTPIRTAVLGYGLGGRIFHCPFVAAVPGLELTAIMQRHGDEAAQAYPSARILRSPEEAFADPNLDLIIVSTPNDTHVDFATRALQAGKHVVIDKPIAPTAEAARSLANLAQQQNRLLAPFHNRRWDGDFLTVHKLITEGTLGRIVEIISRFDRYRPLQRPNTWKEAAGPATGMLVDLGPHLVDQALALFGTPKTITASVRHDRDRTDIDDAFDIVFDCETSGNGGPARPLRYSCHATMIAAEPSPRFLVHGTHGSYRKFGVDPQEPVMVSTGRRPPVLGSPEDEKMPWLREAEAEWGSLAVCPDLNQPAELNRSLLPTLPGDYRGFYANVRDAIQGNASLAVTAEDGYRTLRLLDLARQSSAERRTLPVTWD